MLERVLVSWWWAGPPRTPKHATTRLYTDRGRSTEDFERWRNHQREAAPIDEDERQRIYWRNAVRLLGL